METCLQPVYFCLFVVYLMTLSVTQIMCEGCPKNFAALSKLQSELKVLSFFLSFFPSFFLLFLSFFLSFFPFFLFIFLFFYFMTTAAPQSITFSHTCVDTR